MIGMASFQPSFTLSMRNLRCFAPRTTNELRIRHNESSNVLKDLCFFSVLDHLAGVFEEIVLK